MIGLKGKNILPQERLCHPGKQTGILATCSSFGTMADKMVVYPQNNPRILIRLSIEQSFLSNLYVVAGFFFKVWQCDGTFLGVVQLSDMVVRPSGIHLTSDNRLLISNYLHHQVKVYQLELK